MDHIRVTGLVCRMLNNIRAERMRKDQNRGGGWSSLDCDDSRGAVGSVALSQPPVAPQVLLRRVAGVPEEADYEEDAENEEDAVQDNHDRRDLRSCCCKWCLIFSPLKTKYSDKRSHWLGQSQSDTTIIRTLASNLK